MGERFGDNNAGDVIGAVDKNDVDLGRVDGLIESQADESQWVVLHLVADRETAVPSNQAQEDHGVMRVAYDEVTVRNAPVLRAMESHITRDDAIRLERYYGLPVLGGQEFAKPLDATRAYASGEIARDDVVKVLAQWPYRPQISEETDLLSDPPIWEPGTVHDLEIALDLELIDGEMYDQIVELMPLDSEEGASNANKPPQLQ